MKLAIEIDEQYYAAITNMFRALLPGIEIKKSSACVEYLLKVKLSENRQEVFLEIVLFKQKEELLKERITFKIRDDSDYSRQVKKKIKLGIYNLFSCFFEQEINPWGILTGVRPTKLGNYLLQKGLNYSQLADKLKNEYGITSDKIDLLIEVIKKEKEVLTEFKIKRKEVGIYLGIPFCPSRCIYCSFASYPINKYKRFVEDFLQALFYEIEVIAQHLTKLGIEVSTFYLGGGTPTVLNEAQLEKLLQKLKDSFIMPKEFTVEAGRVDTLSHAKLKLLQEVGVSRICINPQTMNDKTLEQIGRDHSSQDVISTFNRARKLGFSNVNMDLIVGLPGEGAKEVFNTIEQIMKLKPDSITLHALAHKRAAELDSKQQIKNHKKYNHIFNNTIIAIEKEGFKPYYMYRQKNTVANLENIGYAKPGKESLYNILMIEESQTIIALGGGGMSKFINLDTGDITRVNNPRNPAQYIEAIEDKVAKKQLQLTSLFR